MWHLHYSIAGNSLVRRTGVVRDQRALQAFGRNLDQPLAFLQRGLQMRLYPLLESGLNTEILCVGVRSTPWVAFP